MRERKSLSDGVWQAFNVFYIKTEMCKHLRCLTIILLLPAARKKYRGGEQKNENMLSEIDSSLEREENTFTYIRGKAIEF